MILLRNNIYIWFFKSCATATSKLQLQPFLLRPSSTSHPQHQGIPSTTCDSKRSATPRVASPLSSHPADNL
ncbi:unnamed protein product, partial [Vitis vinifera]|uniref:Uncharacterized protein n=1 Tax=Vitis vinifera TaxID=29760 RepID=D7TA43_VITVI